MSAVDLHDGGLDRDLEVLSRRRVISLAGAAGVVALAACSTRGLAPPVPGAVSATADGNGTPVGAQCVSAATPEAPGPYPADGSNGPNVLIEPGIMRSDIRPSFGSYSGVAEGVPATIDLTLRDLRDGCAAGEGMAVYVWQCDRDGEYSLYSPAVADQNYLRGLQVADSAGRVVFSSIFPGCYARRWPHIHFEVFDTLRSAVAGDNARLTSQIALPRQACQTVFAHDPAYTRSIELLSRMTLESDIVFGDGWDAELGTVTGDPARELTISLTVGVG